MRRRRPVPAPAVPDEERDETPAEDLDQTVIMPFRQLMQLVRDCRPILA